MPPLAALGAEVYGRVAALDNRIPAERRAVIAVVTLPITALSSIYGMNVIVNDHTELPALIGVPAVMLVMSVLLLIWAKRRGWR